MALVYGGDVMGRARRAVGWLPADDPENRDYLARVLTMETRMRGPADELTGIAWVVVNRATQSLTGRIKDVVATTRWTGTASRGYYEVVGGTMVGTPPYNAAYALAGQVLSGRVPNPIGPRGHFVHPAGMPSCASGCSERTMCVEGWCLPRWAVSKSAGGKAEYEPIRLGRAVFA